MKRFYPAALLLCVVTVSPLAGADMPMPTTKGAPTTDISRPNRPVGRNTATAYMARGHINRVDKTAGVINITHGPIPALDWPGMTMNFPVLDKMTLARLRPGEWVDFDLTRRPDGRYAISRVAPAR